MAENQGGGPPHGPSVHFNGKQMFAPSDRMTGTQLYAFFQVPENHRLFLETPGKEPDTRILKDETGHEVKNGQHYYDLPEGQFGGMLPRVEKELEDLRAHYSPDKVQAAEQPDGSLLVVIQDVTLPKGWSRQAATIRFVVPPGYPQARPQAFMTNPDVALDANRGPGQGSGVQPPLPDGSQWKQFCWQPKAWDMSRETLLRYAKFAESRFLESQ